MKKAIAGDKENNCERIKWDVLSDNISAQLFYQSLGTKHDAR